jgi:hypothetical protein
MDTLLLTGAQYAQKSDGAVVEGDNLRLDSMPDVLEYAIYEFPLVPDDLATRLAFYTEDHMSSLGKVWLALANYSTGTWEFLPPSTEDTITVGLVNPDDYAGPGGHIFCAVLCWQGDA